MEIKFLGTHNIESRTTKMISYVIDGILAIDAGSMPSELTFDEQQRIKAILVTHGHYDHIIGIPAFAFANTERLTPVFGTAEALDIIHSHLLDGIIYPRLAENESFLGRPVLELTTIEPFKAIQFEHYRITALPVNHPGGAVGYEIKTEKGFSVFCTGDTGPGLTEVWKAIQPDILIVDVTFPNELSSVAEKSCHLCPDLLMKELIEFKLIHNYLPRIITIHLNPQYEKTIENELAIVSKTMNIRINTAKENESYSL